MAVARGKIQPTGRIKLVQPIEVGKVTKSQLDEIVKKKINDLNARDAEHARRMIEGTARSMGLTITGQAPWDAN